MNEQALVETQQSAMDETSDRLNPPSRLRQWIAPAWFLLGMVAGIVGFAGFTTLNDRPAPDTAAMRQAARDGTLDAIATLQAGSSPSSSSAPDVPAAQASSFTVREANRIGAPNAPVTIVEFGDFQ